MSRMKDFLIDVQDLIYTALEAGARTENEIFSFAYTLDKRVDEDTVKAMLRQMALDIDAPCLYN